MISDGLVACQTAPVRRWQAQASFLASATYGGFVMSGVAVGDSAAFSVSSVEAQSMDP